MKNYTCQAHQDRSLYVAVGFVLPQPSCMGCKIHGCWCLSYVPHYMLMHQSNPGEFSIKWHVHLILTVCLDDV